MVSQGHCPMISKYRPSLSKAVGPVDPPFLVVKKNLTLIKLFILERVYEVKNSTTHKVHVGCKYSKTCLKQSLKKKTKQRS